MTGIAQAFFMGYGQGGAWTPASLFASGEEGAWYDPSDLTTMWTDDGVTQAGVGDAVYRIDDKSGNGNHARQTTLSKRPILRQSGALYYLEFDGTDDSLVTAAIDFSATDEMSVFAGVTKDSDAATALLCELSAVAGTGNAGSFYIAAPESTTYEFSTRVSGTVAQAVTRIDSAVYAAPVSVVLAMFSDISADSTDLLLNGTSVATTSGDLGSGNFGNHAFYIGARAGTSLYLNGSIYSLIVRGKTSTAEEIAATEAYVAGKSGVTL